MVVIQIGILSGFDNYMHAYSLSPSFVSQLAFVAIFSYFMVNHKFTLLTINAVFVDCLSCCIENAYKN
ncbi:unnamed protein product [Brassica rapa subsp. trilocularis]